MQAQLVQAQPTKAPVTGTCDGIALGQRVATSRTADGGDTSANLTGASAADKGASHKHWRRHRPWMASRYSKDS
jgi:hypothetical protein